MEKAIGKLTDFIVALVGFLFMSIFAVYVLNIVARYAFGISYIWLPDLARILFIWMVFLGGAAAYVRGQHLLIDFVRNQLREKTLRVTDQLVTVAMGAFFVFLIVKGARVTSVRMNIPYDSWDVVPTAVSYAAVPVAGAIMLLATVVRFVTRLKLGWSQTDTRPDKTPGRE